MVKKKICLFELGPIFNTTTEQMQQTSLSGIRCGNTLKHWLETERDYDLFDAKGDLETLLKCCKIPPSSYIVENNSSNYYHPGKSGSINFQNNDKAAVFGEIHPDILKKMEIDFRVVAFELNLSNLPRETVIDKKKSFNTKYFQKVERDFAFIVGKNTEASTIVSAINSTDNNLIDNICIFDVYEGDGVPEGKMSIAVTVTLQPIKNTLTLNEIDAVSKRIVENVTKKTGAILREK